MTEMPERFTWAVEMLTIEPDFQILEIGCGAGILAEAIANKLYKGSLLAIDRSGAMLTKAKKRNQHHIENGKITFKEADFLNVHLNKNQFDIIVAFNVNFFLKKSHMEFANIIHALHKNGFLYIFFQAPYEIDLTAAELFKENLLSNNFRIIQVQIKKLTPASALCIKAAPIK